MTFISRGHRGNESKVQAREFFAASDDTPTVEKPAEGAQATPAGKPSALPEDEITRLNDEIVIALKTVYDPAVPGPTSTRSA